MFVSKSLIDNINIIIFIVRKYAMDGRILIFAKKKVDCANILNQISLSNFNAEMMHGDISQPQRESTLQNFKKNSI